MLWILKNIVFSCALHLVVSDGYPKETPAQPFNTGSSSGSGGSHGSDSGGYGAAPGGYDSILSTDVTSRYHGPTALLMVLPDGTIANIPEVAAAREAHLAALNKAKALWFGKQDDGSYKHSAEGESEHHSADSMQGYDYSPPQGSDAMQGYDYSPKQGSHGMLSSVHGPPNVPYHGPLASPMVLPSGYLADTHAIAVARAAHHKAVVMAQTGAAAWKAWQ